MKNILLKIASIAILQCCVFSLSAHVYLDSPQGGETYTGHSIITIQWHIAIPHNQLNWDLLYSLDGGNTWEPIQWDLPISQTSYTWVVPNIPTSLARISIIQDNTEMDYQDESLDFTILPASTAPFIDIQAEDTAFQCNNFLTLNINDWLEDHGGATVIGQCGNLVWTHDYTELNNGCNNYTGSAFVTFTATDDCGSTSTGAYLSAIDTIGPNLIRAASNLELQCGPNNNQAIDDWLLHRGGMQIFEACSSVEWSNNYSSLSNGCGDSGNTLVTFAATDECGNITTSTATLTVDDTTGPEISVQAIDKIISCTTINPPEVLQVWLASNGGATANDFCGNVTWISNFSSLSDDCGTSQSAVVVFTAMDDCGNQTNTVAEFKIVDTIAPIIAYPARDTTIHCENLNASSAIQDWLSNHGGAVASDDCGAVLWTNDFPAMTDTCSVTRSFLVNFTSSDECNNSNTTAATITILSITGASNIDTGLNFTLSPNPVKDILKFDSDFETMPVQILIYDAGGRLLHSQRENNSDFYIPVGGYEPGIYLFQIATASGRAIRKVIIH